MTTSYTLSTDAAAWVVQAVAVVPNGTVVYKDCGFNQFSTGSSFAMAPINSPSVGDFGIAHIITTSGASVTAPNANWHQLTQQTGVGTNWTTSSWFGSSNFTLTTFWKLLESGDLSGTQTWSWSTGAAAGLIHVYDGTTINATTPVSATGANVSASSGLVGTGPSPPTPGGFIIECFASTSDASLVTSGVVDRAGSWGGGPVQIVGDYQSVIPDQWHVGVGSGSGWV